MPSTRCSRQGCEARAMPNSTLCRHHLDEKRLQEAAKNAGVVLAHNADGTKTIIQRNSEPPKKRRGENVLAVRDLALWLKSIDADSTKRFQAQLAAAKTFATELDNGVVARASAYRSLIKDIYERIDRVYGAKNVDVVTSLQIKIEENAEKRAQKGWDS